MATGVTTDLPAAPALSGAEWLATAGMWLLLLGGGLWMARLLLGRARRGLPLLAGVAWPPATWSGLETFLLFALEIFCVSLFAAGVGKDAPLLDRMAAQGAGSIVGTLGLVALLRGRGVSWRSLGLGSNDLGGDWRLALGGLLLVTGPLLAVAGFLNTLVPYEHPVIDCLERNQDGWGLVVVAIAAVVAAPVAEEFFFRRLLLGWVDTLCPSPGGALAVGLSATAFGLAHWGQGLGWVPLIPLGVVLGVLARQRGTLVPAILLHALFNAVSVGLLVLQISQRTPG